MDEHVRNIIRKAKAGDAKAASQIEAALKRSMVKPSYFYLVLVNLGDDIEYHYAITKRDALTLLLKLARDYLIEIENNEYEGYLEELGYDPIYQMSDTNVIKAWQNECPLEWVFEIQKTYFEN